MTNVIKFPESVLYEESVPVEMLGVYLTIMKGGDYE